MQREFTAKDGAGLIVSVQTDEDGPYLEVLEPGGLSLGTIRFTTDTRAECDMRIPTSDRYFQEIVKAYRDGILRVPMDPAGLPALLDAIRHLHGVDARWVESVPVRETLPDGRVVWDGEVQVFDLVGHPKATRAYAWSHATEGTRRRFKAVLGLPPVADARTAVQASIVAEFKKGQS